MKISGHGSPTSLTCEEECEKLHAPASVLGKLSPSFEPVSECPDQFPSHQMGPLVVAPEHDWARNWSDANGMQDPTLVGSDHI